MPEGSNKKQHKSIKEEKHMKANQTKVKKKGPYGQSFQERSVALAVLCAGCGADLYFQLHSHVRYPDCLSGLQPRRRNVWTQQLGRIQIFQAVFTESLSVPTNPKYIIIGYLYICSGASRPRSFALLMDQLTNAKFKKPCSPFPTCPTSFQRW
mgnify:CR=1 FL=1